MNTVRYDAISSNWTAARATQPTEGGDGHAAAAPSLVSDGPKTRHDFADSGAWDVLADHHVEHPQLNWHREQVSTSPCPSIVQSLPVFIAGLR